MRFTIRGRRGGGISEKYGGGDKKSKRR